MVHRGQVFDDGSSRMEVTVAADDSAGELHEVRVTYAAGSPPPPAHLHPAQHEHFDVVDGELHFVVDGVLTTVRAGEAIDVPAGSVHQVSNPGDRPATAVWQTRPALRTGEFHEAVAAARAGSGGLPALIAVLEEFADVFRLAPQPAAGSAPAPSA